MSAAEPEAMSVAAWEQVLEQRLPLYGHRNWVVVADWAYPAQTRAGIETVFTDESQQAVVEKTLALLSGSVHVQPKIYVDRELEFVSEEDAPGVSAYRQWLTTAFAKASIQTLPHEEIIAKLDQAAQMFSVLILKSNMVIPYTSVFFELDCGYWNAESESRLRAAMHAKSHE